MSGEGEIIAYVLLGNTRIGLMHQDILHRQSLVCFSLQRTSNPWINHTMHITNLRQQIRRLCLPSQYLLWDTIHYTLNNMDLEDLRVEGSFPIVNCEQCYSSAGQTFFTSSTYQADTCLVEQNRMHRQYYLWNWWPKELSWFFWLDCQIQFAVELPYWTITPASGNVRDIFCQSMT